MTTNELLDPCELCGYREHDIPTSADNGHDSCCCGVDGPCGYLEADGEPCCSHLERSMGIVETPAEVMAAWDEFEFYELDRIEGIPDEIIGAPWF